MAQYQTFASSSSASTPAICNANYNITSASTSTAANPNTNYNYDVFINHRGPDVKKTFASHLYRRLLSYGFRVFLDQQELEEGENLTSQIKAAIATASVHVAIFSKRYAESKWCLDELLLMLKSKATTIPVFYDVRPHELRWTTGESRGTYAEALGNLEKKTTYDSQTHKEKPRYDAKTIENWREALSSVAEISGLELEACNWDEGELVDKVVQLVQKKARKPPFDVATYPTGLDEKLDDFEQTVLLQHDSGEAKVAGIVGLGGVGKTTLAKYFFNRRRSDYHRSSFLFDVREAADMSTLTSLQSKLYKDLTGQDQLIYSTDEGIGMFRHRISPSEALIVLDNVDSLEQMRVLFSPVKDALNSSSFILVTSRNKDVLTQSGIKESSIYKLTGLNRDYSQELFCSHAFHRPYPVVGFEEVVGQFLDACQGLPLSLKVIGALLFLENPNLDYWKAHLFKISKVLPIEIQRRLKISFDSLDEQEKEIFLDIACFFIGEDMDKAIRIWDGSGWGGSISFRNLENKCLVEVDRKNCIRMHDHIRDLGRALAEKESRLRLWRRTDLDVFHQSSVRGISIVKGQTFKEPVEVSNRYVDINGLQLLRAHGDCLGSISNLLTKSDLLWLRWNNFPNASLPSWIPLKNLRVLEVRMASGELKTLWKRKSEAPVQLREMIIGPRLLKFPNSIGKLKHLQKLTVYYIEKLREEFFHLRSMKYLRMRTGVKLQPKAFGNLTNLQHLNLTNCNCLQMLPNSFGNLTNLQYLDLSGCSNLQMLPKSLGNLLRLKHLCLTDCSKLTLSNVTLGNISTLESLDISNCQKMGVLPLQVTHQRALQKLYLWDTNLKELPNAIGNLSNLEILLLKSPKLEVLPASLGNLTCLRELRLHFCNNLKCLPESIGELKQLTEFHLWYAGSMVYLPMGVMELNNLEILNVRYCPLRALPFDRVEMVGAGKEPLTDLRDRRLLDSSIDKCMLRLKDLQLWGTEIKELSFPKGVCPNLLHINIIYGHDLVEVGELPTALISLELQHCSALKKITGLCGLEKLRRLHIYGCDRVEELPGLDTLISLDLKSVVELKRKRKLKWKLGLQRIHELAQSNQISSDDDDERDCSDDESEWIEKKFEELRLWKKDLDGDSKFP